MRIRAKDKKRRAAAIIIGFVLIILLLIIFFLIKKETRKEDGVNESRTEIVVTEAVLNKETSLGADGVILDYADDKQVIFHGYFGLFVYSLTEQKMAAAIDLEAIGCQYTQGDAYCEVQVEADGSFIYLHPINEAFMFIYDLEKQLLYQQTYHKQENVFEGLRETRSCIEQDYTAYRAEECVEINGKAQGYGYLESGSGMLEDLRYVVSGTGENVYLFKNIE